MVKALGIKPRSDRALADYLIDLFVLSGALFNQRLSTFQKDSMERIIEKMNEYEAKDPSSVHISTGTLMIEAEDKDELRGQANVSLLHVLRFLLVQAPPILTMDTKLGNLTNPSNPFDFKFNDLNEYLGKIIENFIMSLGTRYNDEIYFYMSRGILNPNILETIPNDQVL